MIILGRIQAPYGIKGWVRVHAFADDPPAWNKFGQLWLAPQDDAEPSQWKPITLATCRDQGKGLVASFVEIEDRSAAEANVGMFIGARRDALPEPAADEYYWTDLIGMKVLDGAGESLGVVAALLETGAHDVLEVRDGEAERLIPFVGAFVKQVDLAARCVVVEWEKDW